MNRQISAVAAAALAFGLAGAAAAPQTPAPPTTVTPAVKARLDAVRAAGGDKYFGIRGCDAGLPVSMRPARQSADELRKSGGVPGQLQKPAKVFDNFYYLGVRNVTAWALDTPDGIIVFDSLNNASEAESQIEGGLRTLGLDPARIKYVVVHHAHGDHFGGAGYLQKKFGAHVLASDADWKEMAALPPNTRADRSPPPTRDMVVTDGQKLTLGGQTVTLYVTPGHTNGTVSALIPVRDRGQPHLALLWGGTGARDVPEYSRQAFRFLAAAKAAGADVALSNHPEVDGSLLKMPALAARGPNDPNPFIDGRAGAAGFMTAFAECSAVRAMFATAPGAD